MLAFFSLINTWFLFPCDAAAVHLVEVVVVVWTLSCTGRIIDWHSLEEEPACKQSAGSGTKIGRRSEIDSAVWAGPTLKTVELKIMHFWLNSRLRYSRRGAECAELVCEVSKSSSSATAPTIPRAENMISQDSARLHKKVTIPYNNFLGNFRETNLGFKLQREPAWKMELSVSIWGGIGWGTSGVSHYAWNFVTPGTTEAKSAACWGTKAREAGERGAFSAEKFTLDKERLLASGYDYWQGRTGHGHEGVLKPAAADSRREEEGK